MRILLAVSAALALTLVPSFSIAQQAKAKPPSAPKPASSDKAVRPAAAAAPTEAQLKDAADTLSLLISAFNSKDVPTATKNGLMLCLYGNPLGKIARGQAEALAADKTIDAASPTQRLLVVAALCDAPLPKPTDGKPPADPQPTDDKPEPTAKER